MKSVLAQDIARGDGVLLLDPAGTLAEEVLALIPPSRHNHVCYFNIADRDFPIGFNIYADVPPERRSTLAEQVVSAFKSIWFDMWGPQLERLLRASSLALLDTPGTSMVDILRLYFDPDSARKYSPAAATPSPLVFFEREFAHWSQDFLDRAISPVLNKLEAFLSHDLIRNILGQSESTLHMEHALARNRIVIVNLARGAIGDAPAFLMGSLILARTEAAALTRDLTTASPFHVYIEEAQNFKSGVIGSMYSQIRKFKVSLFLVTQDFSALDDKTRAAITANADTIICFRLSPDDAEDMARLFNREHQEFNPVALQNLNVGEAHFHGGRLLRRPRHVHFPAQEDAPASRAARHYGRRREKVEPIITKALLSLTKPATNPTKKNDAPRRRRAPSIYDDHRTKRRRRFARTKPSARDSGSPTACFQSSAASCDSAFSPSIRSSTLLDIEQKVYALPPVSAQKVSRLLRDLYDAGYIERVLGPVTNLTDFSAVRRQPTTYALAQNGAQQLSDTDHIPLDHIDWQLKNNASVHCTSTTPSASPISSSHSSPQQRHGLDLIDHHDFIPYLPPAPRDPKALTLSVTVDGIEYTRRPDRLLALTDHTGTRLPFAHEWHSGEVPNRRDPAALWRGYRQTNFADTIWIYWNARNAGAFKTLWGASNIRILTVTASDESIVNLSRQVARITESPLTKLFLFTTPARLFTEARSRRSGTRRNTPTTMQSIATHSRHCARRHQSPFSITQRSSDPDLLNEYFMSSTLHLPILPPIR